MTGYSSKFVLQKNATFSSYRPNFLPTEIFHEYEGVCRLEVIAETTMLGMKLHEPEIDSNEYGWDTLYIRYVLYVRNDGKIHPRISGMIVNAEKAPVPARSTNSKTSVFAPFDSQ